MAILYVPVACWCQLEAIATSNMKSKDFQRYSPIFFKFIRSKDMKRLRNILRTSDNIDHYRKLNESDSIKNINYNELYETIIFFS